MSRSRSRPRATPTLTNALANNEPGVEVRVGVICSTSTTLTPTPTPMFGHSLLNKSGDSDSDSKWLDRVQNVQRQGFGVRVGVRVARYHDEPGQRAGVGVTSIASIEGK